MMLRKPIVLLFALAATALLAPEEVLARGMGGFRGGGGVHAGGFRAAGVGIGGGGYRAAAIGGGYRVGTFANNAWRTGFYPGYRPWRRFPVAAAAAVGAGLAYGAYPYGYYDDGYYAPAAYNAYYPPYDPEGNYVYDAGGYYGDGGCAIIQRRIPTPYGWVLRPVQVCN